MQIHGPTTERTGLCDGRRQHRPRMTSATCAGHSGWRHTLSAHTHTHAARQVHRQTHTWTSNKGKVQKGKKQTLPDRYCSQNYMSWLPRPGRQAPWCIVLDRLLPGPEHHALVRNNETVELSGTCSSRTHSGTMAQGHVGC